MPSSTSLLNSPRTSAKKRGGGGGGNGNSSGKSPKKLLAGSGGPHKFEHFRPFLVPGSPCRREGGLGAQTAGESEAAGPGASAFGCRRISGAPRLLMACFGRFLCTPWSFLLFFLLEGFKRKPTRSQPKFGVRLIFENPNELSAFRSLLDFSHFLGLVAIFVATSVDSFLAH